MSASAAGRAGPGPWIVSLATYLALSVVLWWQVWSGGPAGHMTCLCGDPGQTVWFLRWAEFAVVHGHDPLLSHAVQVPDGVNVLANNSELLVGLVLAPLTWAAGPVVSFNVAMTLTPVLTALAGAAVCRRFTGWAAAWLGGLIFGFSPFVVGSLPVGHLGVALLALPALQFLCLHELVARQGGSARRWGALLGLLTVAEFFVSTEMLAASVLLAGLFLGVLAAAGAIGRRGWWQARWRHAGQGLVVALAVAIVGLAGPAWFAEAGPRHFTGAVWPFVAVLGNPWASFFVIPPGSDRPSLFNRFGGYGGPVGPPLAYVGPWLLGVVGAGLVLLRRVAVAWLAAGVVLVAGVLSLGARLLPEGRLSSWWLPWRLFQHVPLVENIAPLRLMALGYLFIGLVVALAVDQALEPAGPIRRPAAWRVAAVAMAAAAVIPIGVGYRVPFTTTRAVVPAWFAREGPRLRGDPVLLVLPYDGSRESNAMAWQAVDDMTFRLVGAYAKVPGSNGTVQYAGPPGSAAASLSLLSVPTGPEPAATPRVLAALVAEIRRDRVSEVVVTQTTMRDPAFAAGFVTAALGVAPVVEDGAWVWTHAERDPGPLAVDPGAVEACRTRLGRTAYRRLASLPACVLAGPTVSGP